MKKVICIALCALMTVGSVLTANAAAGQNKNFQVLGSSIKTQNNTAAIYTYNMSNSPRSGVKLKGSTTNNEYKYMFQDSISSPKVYAMPSTEAYNIYTVVGGSSGGSQYVDFRNAGGEYAKVRIKLSAISSMFNDDGTHTRRGHDYKFTYEDLGKGQYYDSVLFFQSGGVFTGVTPDQNGYAEIYVSTKVDERVRFYTDYNYCKGNTIGSGGGTNGYAVNQLTFGNINQDYFVNVNDVTALQQYLSGDIKLDSWQMFHADINRDSKRDVRDVTALQDALTQT